MCDIISEIVEYISIVAIVVIAITIVVTVLEGLGISFALPWIFG